MPELRAEALRSEHSAQLELFLEYAFFVLVRVPERPFATNLIALLPADDVGDEAAVAPGKGAREERLAAESGAESRAAAAASVPEWKRRAGAGAHRAGAGAHWSTSCRTRRQMAGVASTTSPPLRSPLPDLFASAEQTRVCLHNLPICTLTKYSYMTDLTTIASLC